jgi:protein-S-isoprenylcysteine O-methyltransferase Ste14
MYLGLVLGLLGWAVLLGSLVPFVVVPAFFALIHFRLALVHGGWRRSDERRRHGLC